jgi:pyridoxal phosphate enzyme (YggS family)
VPESIAGRLAAVRRRIAEASSRAGRDPAGVRLVGVMKVVDPQAVEAAAAQDLTDIGTNRAQELRDKAPASPPGTRWHYLGRLQTNKIRYLDDVRLIHGLQRPAEAEALQRRGEQLGRSWDVLVEVNVAGEASKQGIAPDELPGLVEGLATCPLVRPVGIMIMAPQVEKAEDVRWVFARAQQLRDASETRLGLRELSMGMTDDFEIAIEEGATIVRIGRAIFS